MTTNTDPVAMPQRIAIGIATMLLGALALACAFVFAMSFLMFDNPSAENSITTWNLALAHPVFVLAYLFALPCGIEAAFMGKRNQARLFLIAVSAGIGWLVLAWGIVIFVCHGRFVCAVIN
jgi:hypothetical protein